MKHPSSRPGQISITIRVFVHLYIFLQGKCRFFESKNVFYTFLSQCPINRRLLSKPLILPDLSITTIFLLLQAQRGDFFEFHLLP